METTNHALSMLLDFAFYYPLVMSLLWMSGSIIYFLRWERREPPRNEPAPLPSQPPISILVPCHNEGTHIRETIE